MNQAEREAYLDGYRHGLGSAVRAVERVREQIPNLHNIPVDSHDIVRLVLTGVAGGLRLLSASVVLAEPECSDDD